MNIIRRKDKNIHPSNCPFLWPFSELSYKDKGKGLNSRLSDLIADVEDLKKKKWRRRIISHNYSRSRSSTPKLEWASQCPRGEQVHMKIIETLRIWQENYHLLTHSCTWGMSNETKKPIRSHFKFPKVDVTRFPKLDVIVKNITS